MTDPKYDKATKVGIENALELLEELYESTLQEILNEGREYEIGKRGGVLEKLSKAIEIVKLNLPKNKHEQ